MILVISVNLIFSLLLFISMIRDINYLQYISSFKSVTFDAHHCLSEECWAKF